MELVKYSINAAEIAKMSDIYMGLTVKSLDDEEGLAAVHSARMVVVKHRTSIDKLRKSSNEDAQAFIKNNNNNAKKLLALIEPIENHLKSEEGKIEAEKARIKEESDQIAKEKIQKRIDTLFALNVILPFSDVATMSDEEYSALLDKSQANFEDEQRRIAVEKSTMAAEEKKLAIERAELDRIRAEQEAMAKAQAEREGALKRQERAIEDARQKEIERKDRAEFERKAKEKLTKDARFESLQNVGFTYPFDDLGTMPDVQYTKMYGEHHKAWDAKQQVILIEKLEKERTEKEAVAVAEKARLELLLPDKERLVALAAEINRISFPEVKSNDAKQIASFAFQELATIADNLILQSKEL